MDDRMRQGGRGGGDDGDAAAQAARAGRVSGGSARGGGASESAEAAAPPRLLTWSEAETMDILADADMMASIAEGKEDVKAGRLVPWKPRGAGRARPA